MQKAPALVQIEKSESERKGVKTNQRERKEKSSPCHKPNSILSLTMILSILLFFQVPKV